MPKYTKQERKNRRRTYRKMIRRSEFGQSQWGDISTYKRKVKEMKHHNQKFNFLTR